MRVKRAALPVALLFVAILLSSSAQTNDREKAANPLSILAWLVGDWHAVSESKAGSKHSLKTGSRFRSELAGRMMTLTMSHAEHSIMNGMFAYDGAKKAVVFLYVVSNPEDTMSEDNGTLVAGVVKTEQESLLLDGTATRPDGATGHVQTRVERIDANHYRWDVYADYPGERLQKLNEIVFARGL